MHNIIAIGDIHGCQKQLDEILEKAKTYPTHSFVFLGDYIDRGTDAEYVCKKVASLNAICLKGNHEEMLLNRARHNPDDLDKLLGMAKISKESFSWINNSLFPVYSAGKYIFVHAGLDVSKPLDQQTEFDYLWTRYDNNYYSITNKTVIHGHMIVSEPVVCGNRININTGCGSGGYLTALVLPEMVYLASSVSQGIEYDWAGIRKELEADIEELLVIEEEE